MPLTAEQRRTEFLALMKRADWSAAETARRLHMSEASISGYKKENAPPLRTLESLRREVLKFLDEETESSGKNLEPPQNRGVTKTTARGFPPTRQEREEVFSIHEQPGGKRSDDPELEEAIRRLIHLRHSDPDRYEKYLRDIAWDHERIVAQSKSQKKK